MPARGGGIGWPDICDERRKMRSRSTPRRVSLEHALEQRRGEQHKRVDAVVRYADATALRNCGKYYLPPSEKPICLRASIHLTSRISF